MIKKRNSFRCSKLLCLAAVTLILTLLFAACAKYDFSGVADSSGKRITINAENSKKDDFAMTGSLEVKSGEQIVVTSDLSKGQIKLEVFGEPEEQSADKMPELEGSPILTVNAGGPDFQNKTETISSSVPAGSYIIKAVCIESATGTVLIESK